MSNLTLAREQVRARVGQPDGGLQAAHAAAGRPRAGRDLPGREPHRRVVEPHLARVRARLPGHAGGARDRPAAARLLARAPDPQRAAAPRGAGPPRRPGERRRAPPDRPASCTTGRCRTSPGIAFELGATADRIPEDTEVRRTLRRGASVSRESMRALRTLLVDLYPQDRRDEGIDAALDALAQPLRVAWPRGPDRHARRAPARPRHRGDRLPRHAGGAAQRRPARRRDLGRDLAERERRRHEARRSPTTAAA